MNKYRNNIWFRTIAITVVSLFMANNAIFAVPSEIATENSTLATESRLRPFFEKRLIAFQDRVGLIYAAERLRGLVNDMKATDDTAILREINRLNSLFPGSRMKIREGVYWDTLRKGRLYKYVVFEFPDSKTVINALFFPDYAPDKKLTAEELIELGIRDDEKHHLDCPGLEGVWFTSHVSADNLTRTSPVDQKLNEAIPEFNAVHKTDIIERIRLLAGRNVSHKIRILDIGSGPEAYLARSIMMELGDAVEVVTVDKASKSNKLSSNIQYIQGDAKTVLEGLASERERFDVIVSNRALPYFNDPITVLRLSEELLSTGGFMSHSMMLTKDMTGRSGEEIAAQLRGEGFQVTRKPSECTYHARTYKIADVSDKASGANTANTDRGVLVEDRLETLSYDVFYIDKKAESLKDGLNRTAFEELEDGTRKALERYSNVHRGKGHHSAISTELFEISRDIVLEYLGLDKKDYIVIFGNSRNLDMLESRLKKGSRPYRISSDEIGLSLGVNAIAVRKSDLPGGRPFHTGGGVVELVSKRFVIWANPPDKFEAGTPNIAGVIAFARALKIIGHHKDKDIFKQKPVTLSVEDILYGEDGLKGLQGEELLTRLRRLLIGDGAMVPVSGGERPYTNFDNGASAPTFLPIWDVTRMVLKQPKEALRPLIDEARKICLRFFGDLSSDRYDVIFTSNTTDGLNLLADSFREAAVNHKESHGETVILNTLVEHHSNELPWRYIPGVSLKRLDVDREGFVDFDEMEKALREYNVEKKHGVKRIRLVAMSGASNVLGSLNDIARASALAHKYGARILVDAAQLTAHDRIDMEKDAIDYLVCSSHKMYAPFGSGALVVRKGLAQDGRRYLEFDDKDMRSIKRSGEENAAGIVSMAKAMMILQRIDMKAVKSYEAKLTARALKGLSEIPGVEIFGVQSAESENFERKGGVITFSIRGMPHNLAAKMLAELGGIGVRTGCFCAHMLTKKLMGTSAAMNTFSNVMLILMPKTTSKFLHGLIRASFGIENTEEEVDHFISMVREISAKRVSLINRIIGLVHGATPFLPETAEAEKARELVDSTVREVYDSFEEARAPPEEARKPTAMHQDRASEPPTHAPGPNPTKNVRYGNGPGSPDDQVTALERKARGELIPVAARQSESEEYADQIHRMNLQYPPAASDKKIVCHIVTDSILPYKQRDALLQKLDQEMRDRDYYEKVVRFTNRDPDHFLDELRARIEEKRAEYKRMYGDDCVVEFNIACPDVGLVNALLASDLGSSGVKALAFKPCAEVDVDAIQVEGILLALRALKSNSLDKLYKIYKFLAGRDLTPQEAKNIRTIDDFVRSVAFIVPIVKIDVNKLDDINRIILKNIKVAA